MKKLDDDGLSESSEEDEEDEDEDEENQYQKKKEVVQKVFEHDEACDIEEAQIVDVFQDVRDELEYNLLDIEEKAEKIIKKSKEDEDGRKKIRTDDENKNENIYIE